VIMIEVAVDDMAAEERQVEQAAFTFTESVIATGPVHVEVRPGHEKNFGQTLRA